MRRPTGRHFSEDVDQLRGTQQKKGKINRPCSFFKETTAYVLFFSLLDRHTPTNYLFCTEGTYRLQHHVGIHFWYVLKDSQLASNYYINNYTYHFPGSPSLGEAVELLSGLSLNDTDQMWEEARKAYEVNKLGHPLTPSGEPLSPIVKCKRRFRSKGNMLTILPRLNAYIFDCVI